ncbi:MAG: polyketide synthase dehydratase domain-containing protein, partial [Deltaproteobacteria bacterium]|nr:polyketide synthase dehydratase domain-containing protein [Deltaproteobacteria bacterium]
RRAAELGHAGARHDLGRLYQMDLEGDAGFGHVLALPAPDMPELAGAEFLGAPLPLDGAMHAACVHGQQVADFVPFPVSFAMRRICRPIRPGECCEVRLRLVRQAADFLCYDLWLLRDGMVCEEIRSLAMRDVSGGKIRPPAWWRNG